MRIAVIGAGIVGVTSAYELASDGHEVTVLERRSAVAEEASFANAGIVAPGYVTPWAAPGMPGKVLGHLLSSHAPVRLSMPLSSQELRWMWRWYRACRLETYLAQRTQLQRLAFYSRQRMHHLSAALQLDYERSQGYLVLLRSEQDRRRMQAGLQVLRDAGVNFQEITAEAARSIEPALNPDTGFVAAIHLPDDEVGNCRQFALLLKAQAQQIGVKFYFNTEVDRLEPGSGISLHGKGGTPRRFDAVVVCAAMGGKRLLEPLGLNVPMIAVHGYSVSASVREPLNAPRSAIMDERYKVAISRLGKRVRVAGSAEIGGALRQHNAAALRTLYKVLQDWYPGAAHLNDSVQVFKGSRPMFADRAPMVGACGIDGLWLNLGHGSSGWALSCGSARALADMVAGKPPEVDMGGCAYKLRGV